MGIPPQEDLDHLGIFSEHRSHEGRVAIHPGNVFQHLQQVRTNTHAVQLLLDQKGGLGDVLGDLGIGADGHNLFTPADLPEADDGHISPIVDLGPLLLQHFSGKDPSFVEKTEIDRILLQGIIKVS